MTCGVMIRDSDLRRPYLCRCEYCDAQRGLLEGHWFEQVLHAGLPTGVIKCRLCGIETKPIGRGEPIGLHEVYCFPDPEDNPDLPHGARAHRIRTRAEALALWQRKDLPADVIEWLIPENPHAEEIRAMCIELIRAATTTIVTGVPTRRLFIACRRALQREHRSLLGKTHRR